MADTAIQVTLHSNGASPNAVGITNAGDLVQNGRFISASEAKIIRQIDDFHGDVLASNWNTRVGSDGACVAGAINSQIGGVVRMVFGAGAGATMAVNGGQLSTGAFLNWKAANGGLRFQTRIALNAVTAVAIFAGFTDQDSALEMPFTISGSTLTSNASDSVGFLYDTSATASTIKLVGVKGDTDATVTNTGIAMVAATFIDLALTVDASETARFWINGALVGTMASSLTKTVALTPVIAGFSREAVLKNADTDYISLEMHRT